MGYAYFFLRVYQKGIEVVNHALIQHPKDNFLLWILAVLQTGNGDYQEAIKTFRQRTAGTETNWMLGYTLGVVGQKEEAVKILDYQLKRREQQHVPAFFVAAVYMGIGNEEKAMEWLEKDYAEGGQGLMFWGLKTDERFDPIRDNPRFQNLLGKIH